MGEPTFDVTTVGEGGLRLSVPLGERLRAAQSLDLTVIGTELNVAGTLARLGWRSQWISAVHDGPLGDRVIEHAVANGIAVDLVRRHEVGRTGSYFVEYGAPPLPTSVVYDRSDTTFAQMGVDGVDWDRALDARLVHVSGLTVGLGGAARKAVEEVVRRAASAEVPISVDVNHRDQLWTTEEARAALEPILAAATIVSCSERDAAAVLGEHGDHHDRVRSLANRYELEHLVMSVGANGALCYCRATDQVSAAPARTEQIVDRLGAGDGLMAGALHGWLSARPEDMVTFGTVVAGLAMVQHGEVVRTSAAEVEALAQSDQRLIR